MKISVLAINTEEKLACLSFLLQCMGLMEPISRLASHQSWKTSRCHWHLLYPWAGPNSAPGLGFAWPHPPHETYKTEPLGLGGIILLETEQRHSRDFERACRSAALAGTGCEKLVLG